MKIPEQDQAELKISKREEKEEIGQKTHHTQERSKCI